MSKNNRKDENINTNPTLRDDELGNPGVGKILFNENIRLKAEIDALKKSLKFNQNELEKLRAKNHELDKANSILDFRLNTALLPELLKYLASLVGSGFAVGFFFNGKIECAVISFALSIAIYVGILILYKSHNPHN
jgi:hypothetical protein